MRKSIGSSFLFLRSRKGGGAYESDLNMAGKQSTKSKNQSKPKEEIIMSKKRSILEHNLQSPGRLRREVVCGSPDHELQEEYQA